MKVFFDESKGPYNGLVFCILRLMSQVRKYSLSQKEKSIGLMVIYRFLSIFNSPSEDFTDFPVEEVVLGRLGWEDPPFFFQISYSL